jgi:2-keto-3-deoxy-6-phosphogluconate aldolase
MTPERRHTVIEEIARLKVSAIIRTNSTESAAAAMEAAVAGGFRMVEFTLTTPGALELIKQFSSRGDLLVGAGTVLTVEQAARG